MATTHPVRVPQATRTSESGTVVGAEDRYLWLQVAVASGLGATAALLGTWAILATQTLQMHF